MVRLLRYLIREEKLVKLVSGTNTVGCASIRRTTSRMLSILLHTEIFKMQAKALNRLSLYL